MRNPSGAAKGSRTTSDSGEASPDPAAHAFQADDALWHAALHQWPFVLLVGLAFFLLCNLTLLASPVTIVCFFLFGLVAVYGLATFAIRRAIPAVVTILLFFAVLAGVQPYKYRYDGYATADGWVEGLDYHSTLDLYPPQE